MQNVKNRIRVLQEACSLSSEIIVIFTVTSEMSGGSK